MTEIATQQDVDAQPGFPAGLQGVRRPESCRAANRHEPAYRSFAAGGWAARALGSGKACALVRHAPDRMLALCSATVPRSISGEASSSSWVRTMMQVQFNRCVIAAQDPRAPENVLIPDADTTHKFTLAELEALLAECDKELITFSEQCLPVPTPSRVRKDLGCAISASPMD